MNGEINALNEILYLCKKDNKEIYVNNVESLSQHQIDGIRFIYKQLINKNPGVILNDPPGYGKSLLTVSFLKAVVQCLLKKPILIIASEDEDLLKWNELFQKSGIDVESKNPLVKKQVFATLTNKFNLFKSKEWSVVVVHENQASKVIINTNIKCEFKIWITSVDLKNNIKTLETIYTWITKEHFEMKQFIPDNDPYDIIKKSILLDIFLEDIYYRSSCNFISVEEKAQSEITSIKVQNQITRGKKDLTGSKIKKSKRRLDDDDLPDVSHEKVSNNQENIKTRKDTNSSEELVESKIASSTKEDTDKQYNAQNKQPEPITMEQSDLKCNQSVDSENGSITDSQSVSFEKAIRDIVDHEKDVKIENDEDGYNFTAHVTNNGLIEKMEIESPTKKHTNNSSFTTQDFHLKLEPEISNNMNISETVDSNADKSSQNIDSKLQELEEMTLKKFKGSFLDSIF